ncbi:MAG: hypothetical protein J5630_02340, partial [Bacteroidaceae bacterium]|nr:hypothetical protein [Bacteroidaceae bacterium]
MNRIQRLLTLLLLVCGMTTGAWAQESVTDLSATATANTYIVSAAGNYKFNATVKGNGGLDPLTGTTATPIAPANIAGVKVLWELGDTYGRAIKYEGGAYDISYSDGYVYFSTPSTFTTGVACVAIYDSSDNILWSWNIWSTPEPGTVTHNGKTFMDRNLCAIDLNSNRGFLYQWGRKDAFSAATGAYASFTFVPTLFTAFNTVTGIQTIDYCIKHPTTHVNNGDENSWMSEEEYNTLPWRDNIKTIYDPCPAGWRVPTAAQQNGFSGLPGTGFSNSINEFGNPGSGYYRSSTISSYPKAYAFRQSGEQNNWGTNPAFAIRPVQEPEPVPIDLQQDDEGYYLLGSVQDWRGFTEQIKYTPTANARMTADIDLGDDQTTVGTMETPFQGIFDGQGHTLTINFTPAEERFGLFRFISGATIRNLNVTGTINMAYRMVGSLVGRTDGGINNITNCRSSVHINSTTDEGHQTGGLVGRVSADVTLNISDCVFDGSIVGQSSSDYCGGIVGYNVGTLNMSNCLFMPETAEIGSSYTSTLVQDGGTTNISNCYYTSAMGTVQG